MKKAFTLIELLVVIAIIALLLSIVVPSLRMAKEHARRTICGTGLKSMGTAFALYAQTNDDFLPPTRYSTIYSKDPGPMPFRTYWAYTVDTSRPYGEHIYKDMSWGAGTLYSAQLIETPETFYCPSTPRTKDDTEGEVFHYDGYHDAEHPWPWNNQNSEVNRPVRIPYSYLPQSARERDKWGFSKVADKSSQQHSGMTMMTDLLTSRTILAHTRGFRGGSSSSTGRGVNALYPDGGVRFNNNSEAFVDTLWKPSPSSNNTNFRTILQLVQ
jgi:prepilin-type N-terminal cleavage/methylation domain-containing protein